MDKILPKKNANKVNKNLIKYTKGEYFNLFFCKNPYLSLPLQCSHYNLPALPIALLFLTSQFWDFDKLSDGTVSYVELRCKSKFKSA
jgi:hypothetical protein